MAERAYTDEERELAVRAAEEAGDQRVAKIMGCSEATIRSWRHRAQRKTVDKRARDDNSDTPTVELVDVMVPDGGWDGSAGCETKVPARARVVKHFKLAAELMSMAPMRHLGVAASEAAGLGAGQIVLLGGERFAAFADAKWEVVSRGGRWRDQYPYTPTLPRSVDPTTGHSNHSPTADDPDLLADFVLLIVRPARLARDTQLSADGARIEVRTAANEKPNPLAKTLEQRLRGWDSQPPLRTA